MSTTIKASGNYGGSRSLTVATHPSNTQVYIAVNQGQGENIPGGLLNINVGRTELLEALGAVEKPEPAFVFPTRFGAVITGQSKATGERTAFVFHPDPDEVTPWRRATGVDWTEFAILDQFTDLRVEFEGVQA
jgi:hypothetical protein